MFAMLFAGLLEVSETTKASSYAEPTHSGYSEERKLKSKAIACASAGVTKVKLSEAQSSDPETPLQADPPRSLEVESSCVEYADETSGFAEPAPATPVEIQAKLGPLAGVRAPRPWNAAAWRGISLRTTPLA